MDSHPGRLYLGQDYDFVRSRAGSSEVLLTARTLTEHALSMGGTPKSRAERALVLLEETLLQDIPCIAVDALGFTQPLVDCVQREGYASALRERAHADVYTPGSSSGLPVSVLSCFQPPMAARPRRLAQADDQRESLDDLIHGLLALIADDSDRPLGQVDRNRVLLQLALEPAWRAGVALTPALLLRQLQDPPVRRIGAVDLDTLYPPADRATLILALSRAMAQPLFANWGETATPLDVAHLITPKPTAGRPIGKTRLVVFRVDALNSNEVGFFATMLLSAASRWACTQTGAPVLRLLIYLDEASTHALLRAVSALPSFPLQTWMNRCRPSGLGLVLSAAMEHSLEVAQRLPAHIWLVGRLVEEKVRQSFARLLADSSGANDIGYLETTLGALPNEVFLLRYRSNAARYVHLRAPVCLGDAMLSAESLA